jgi:hypothetical protein
MPKRTDSTNNFPPSTENKYISFNFFCLDIVVLSNMSDVYELAKSEQVQEVDRETPYENKQ